MQTVKQSKLDKAIAKKAADNNCTVFEAMYKILQDVDSGVKIAELWCEDQSNGLTDSQICMATLKDIRRFLGATK